MKKLFFILALGLASLAGRGLAAQVVVDGVNINNLEQINMIRMIAQERFLSNKIVVFIDYGQNIQGGVRNRMEVIDPRSGDRVMFNSVIHAVNYMIDNGWEYIESMVLPSDGSANSTGSVQYLFRRNLTGR